MREGRLNFISPDGHCKLIDENEPLPEKRKPGKPKKNNNN
jgi:hypothetical protein